jgi:VWFA-related protein
VEDGIAKPFCCHPAAPFRVAWIRFLTGVLFVCCVSAACAQTQPSSVQESRSEAPRSAQKPDAAAPNDEIISHDTPFKVRVNLVVVRVVVRDAAGKAVTNLKKEDFQLADNRKPQMISSFSVETPASHIPTVKADTEAGPVPSQGTQVNAPELPQRFVTLFFDDIHLSVQDALLARQAATKLFGAMQSSDRLSIFTTSGQVQQEFTADRNKLEEALQRILPHPLSTRGPSDCPPLTFYEAYLIVEAKDPEASQVAAEDAAACAGRTGPMLVQQAAQRELTLGEAELHFSFRSLDALIRRMSALPGQRILVMMSPGFFVTPSMHESDEIIERATKANIVINTIDARGLYVSSVYDASNKSMSPIGALAAARTAFITAEESMQQDILAELADGTGGVFFHNRNDIDQGLLQAAAEPEVSYVLGFVPQNLKFDGKYHHLEVTLINKQKWALQARHGYFAPQGESDPEARANEEMQQAIFSQEELRELPIDCRTQFFRGVNGTRLIVVARLETKELKFRKTGDRNTDKLTASVVIFDGNGNLITGEQKTMDLRLTDATLARINKTGISVKSSFELQPGNYLVRVVMRDSEGAQMAATNLGVVIP